MKNISTKGRKGDWLLCAHSDEKAKAIDQRIFDLYGLTQEERDAIGYIDYHNNNDNEPDDDE